MSGEDFQEEAVLAAVKPLRAAELMESETKDVVSAGRNSMSSSVVENQSALEILFRQHSDRVFRTAHRVTGSAADAEDILQTVFLRLARSTESPSGLENPEGYFARAAINASLDLLRSRKRSRAVAFDDVESEAAVAALTSTKNPEAGHEDRELRNLIRAAVSRLGANAAQMFTLRYFEGYDNGEIALIMSTSALVVGVTLHRARARLRKEIGSYLQKHSSA
jgi:RNA polymerase sigma factor (sigma-70 family)